MSTRLTKHSIRVLADLISTAAQFTDEHTNEQCTEFLSECLIIIYLPNEPNDWLDGILGNPQFVDLCDSLEEKRPGIGKWLVQTVTVQQTLYHKENEQLRKRLN